LGQGSPCRIFGRAGCLNMHAIWREMVVRVTRSNIGSQTRVLSKNLIRPGFAA
jgi:hypothetical protein